jgi:hypothetical protein
VPDLQKAVFGTAASQGWLGSDRAYSFKLLDRRYVWMFGDTLTNMTDKSAARREERSGTAECNYFASRECAMPTNSFAIWDGSRAAGGDTDLQFDMKFDHRSGQPTSTLWPPGWGGAGQAPKRPACDGCGLWRPPTVLRRTEAECAALGAKGVQMDKGGCCFRDDPVCLGYCCHAELYFRPMAGLASLEGDRVLIMASMGRQSNLMPEQGRSYATYAVSMRNTSTVDEPSRWEYLSDRMPDTHVWPWSEPNGTRQFHLGVVRAPYKTSRVDLVYLLGLVGDARVLARADLPDLLEFRWERMQFWATDGDHGAWMTYKEATKVPKLRPLWTSPPAEDSIYFDEGLQMWMVPEVDSISKILTLRVARAITGPYKRWAVGRLPPDIVTGELAYWDVRSVRSHPELNSTQCRWVFSMTFHWREARTPPPVPGVHFFPRLVCVGGEGEPSKGPIPEDGAMDCSDEMFKKMEETSACSEVGDGCHTCKERAEWIVRHVRRNLDVAYGIVAAEFPQDCGMVLACKDRLAKMALMVVPPAPPPQPAPPLQGWDAEAMPPVAPGSTTGPAAAALLAALAAGALLATLALLGARWSHGAARALSPVAPLGGGVRARVAEEPLAAGDGAAARGLLQASRPYGQAG